MATPQELYDETKTRLDLNIAKIPDFEGGDCKIKAMSCFNQAVICLCCSLCLIGV